MFSISITGPIFPLLFLGFLLKRVNIINDEFIRVASQLVFKVTLPALLFLSIVKSPLDTDIDFSFIAYMLLGNFLFFILVTLLTKYWIPNKQDHGVIIQGSFRANAGIIGLAYAANVYGDAGITLAALYVAFNTVLYNILAVIILTPSIGSVNRAALINVFKSIAKNPLIIAILVAALVFILAIPIPTLMINAGQYFADMTLPMALLCTGGSLNLKKVNNDTVNTLFATALKLIVAPIMLTGASYFLGFRGLELGIAFFMTAAPTAVASYMMASAMGENVNLAANIIAMTTAGSLITCSLGISLLYSLHLI
nr:AEC family transporter [Psychromonas antarctica]